MQYKQEIEKIEKTYNQKLALSAIRQIEMIMLADPKHIFSVKELILKELVPWVKHRQTFTKPAGIFDRGVLKVKIIRAKNPNNNEYRMKGKDIISYLQEHSNL